MTQYAESFNERVEGALSEEAKRRYRNAVELHYKAMVHLIDYLLLHTKNIIIESLKQRLEETNSLDPDINAIFREVHVIYRGTYRTKNTMEDCKKLKNGIKAIARLGRIEADFQEGLEKIS
ncbi:hypothetical protein J4212_02735 [Candidatus Woesearchaeota archaeon]|nr:hypothetical protein [Candidatus Woesearchaeota archaeon]